MCEYGFIYTCIRISVCSHRQGRQQGKRGFQIGDEVLWRSGSKFNFYARITCTHCPGPTMTPAAAFAAVSPGDNSGRYTSLPGEASRSGAHSESSPCLQNLEQPAALSLKGAHIHAGDTSQGLALCDSVSSTGLGSLFPFYRRENRGLESISDPSNPRSHNQ